MSHGRQQRRNRQPTTPISTLSALGQATASALLVLLLLSFKAVAPCAAQPAKQPLCYWSSSDGVCSLDFAVHAASLASINLHLSQQLAALQQKTWQCKAAGSAVWQQACAADQTEQCTTLQAADGNSAFCVARGVAEGSADDKQALLTVLVELDSGSKWCSNRTSAEACAAADLLPYLPAVNTTCRPDILHQPFDGCCVDTDPADFSSKGLSGWLPDRVTPSKGFTDLSNNPALCGTLPLTRATGTSISSMQPAPVKLLNSNVKIDLSELGSLNGPMIARWLGDGAIAYNNLYSKLSLDGSHFMCVFLRTGKLSVAGSDACKPSGGSSCTCKGGLAVLLHGSSEEWAACHRGVTNMSFDSSLHQAKALAQYDKYMLGEEPAFACGKGGRSYRDKIAALVWCVTSVVIIVLCAIAYVYREQLGIWVHEDARLPRASSASSQRTAPDDAHWLRLAIAAALHQLAETVRNRRQHVSAPAPPPAAGNRSNSSRQPYKWWVKALFLTSYALLHTADLVSDWLYLYNVARSGNLQVLLHLGWLLLAPYLVVQLVYAACLLRCRAHLWRPVTAAVLFVEAVIAVSLPAVATSRLLRYAGSRSYVTQADCIRMAWMFFACAVFSQLVLFVVGLLWKARSYFARHESGDQRDAADALAVLGDALFLALEDVPQLIMQTVFWVSGMALLPAWVYGISTALSLLGLSFGVGHVALRVRRQGGGLKWCADLAAAWRLQLIVVTGGNQ